MGQAQENEQSTKLWLLESCEQASHFAAKFELSWGPLHQT